ncbi:hypothetical protein BCR37DRAFT_391427 [Protomyces lactucae-debilis]|uniref:Uncharacterized protein n=1 Tax=Protomyces lactucae-debilis TaxID=2754530 RepID=A0A1Y2FNX4_PROLT|nr:uncharacterized protein BCR37DRAFT_391427 [Protomyces lactucae-debilis]ORY85663.1 hypothetical protein BCR37DRAFT_391427 [Protomyces lactucae-debilis]
MPVKKATQQVINIESDDDHAPACNMKNDKIYDFPDDPAVKHQAEPAVGKKRKREPARKEKVKEVFSKEYINSSDEDSDLIDLGTSQRRLVKKKPDEKNTRLNESCKSAKVPGVVPRAAVKITPRRTIDDYCAGPLSSSDSNGSDSESELIIKKKVTPAVARKGSPKETKASKSITHASSQARRISSSKTEQDAIASMLTPVSPEASKPKAMPLTSAQQRTGARSPFETTKSSADVETIGKSLPTPPSPMNVKVVVTPQMAFNQAIAQEVLRGLAQAGRKPLQASISQMNLPTVVSSEVRPAGSSLEVRTAQATTITVSPVKVVSDLGSGRVINYAASTALPIAVKPRLATGLSRRQRVEPLHKIIKK